MLLSHAQLQNELVNRLAYLTQQFDDLNAKLCNNRALQGQPTDGAEPKKPSLMDELVGANGRLSDEINNLEVVYNVLAQLIGPTSDEKTTVSEPIPGFFRKGRDILGEALDNATDERTNG